MATDHKPQTEDARQLITAKIASSKDIQTERARKCILWMFNEAVRGLHDVKLVFDDSQADLGAEVVHGIHDMRIWNGSTHLGRFLDEHDIKIEIGSGNNRFLGGRAAWVFFGKRHARGSGGAFESARQLELDMDAIDAIELPVSQP